MKLLLLCLPVILLLLISCEERVTQPPLLVAAPVIEPSGGTVYVQQPISISCSTPDARIYYTLDGSIPTLLSSFYLNPIRLNGAATIKARAFKSGFTDSPVTQADFVVEAQPVVATPVFQPNGGTFTDSISVTITCATPGAEIRYTINAGYPSATSPLYTQPLVITNSGTIRVRAFKTNYITSEPAFASFTEVPDYGAMVYIPGGTFNMGNTSGTGGSNELPVHSVTLSPYYIAKYELTQLEWYQVMGYTAGNFTFGIGSMLPAYNISRYELMVYCNLRSIAEGLDPVYHVIGPYPEDWGDVPTQNNANWNTAWCNMQANGYRMPSEAEWEFAARGGTNNPDYIYAGSNNQDAVAWYSPLNQIMPLKPIGTKAPNGLGLYDMSGNAYEFCWDWSDEYTSGHQVNPVGPAYWYHTYAVVRGGACCYGADWAMVSHRNGFMPYTRDVVGIRLVRSAW